MNKILLLSAFISLNAVASADTVQFGRIVDLKGEGFISYNGKTREIKKGDVIEIGAEIVIEHHGQVTFTDNADHRFHLGNASSASVSGNSVELRSGDLWFQSLNKNDNYKIQTANAVVNYQGGEAIISYDTVKSKTQLLVINGMMSLANLRAPELNLSVAEGHFSFIDNAYDEGAPRDPTSVGQKTYKELVSLFDGVSPMDKHSAGIFKTEATRAVASVEEHITEPKKVEGTSKLIEEYKEALLSDAAPKKHEVKKAAIKKVARKLNKVVTAQKLVVHIYGQKKSANTSSVAKNEESHVIKQRAPASVLDQPVPAAEAITRAPVAPATPYSKDYKNQYKESDKLIDDLQKL